MVSCDIAFKYIGQTQDISSHATIRQIRITNEGLMTLFKTNKKLLLILQSIIWVINLASF